MIARHLSWMDVAAAAAVVVVVVAVGGVEVHSYDVMSGTWAKSPVHGGIAVEIVETAGGSAPAAAIIVVAADGAAADTATGFVAAAAAEAADDAHQASTLAVPVSAAFAPLAAEP